MVNCAHPSHFDSVLDPGAPWADDYLALRQKLPQLTVLGGCCGTTHEHVSAISAAFNGSGVHR
jgi:S-methylmethionine-dependent homocysteine/selenocysteine methylase